MPVKAFCLSGGSHATRWCFDFEKSPDQISHLALILLRPRSAVPPNCSLQHPKAKAKFCTFEEAHPREPPWTKRRSLGPELGRKLKSRSIKGALKWPKCDGD